MYGKGPAAWDPAGGETPSFRHCGAARSRLRRRWRPEDGDRPLAILGTRLALLAGPLERACRSLSPLRSSGRPRPRLICISKRASEDHARRPALKLRRFLSIETRHVGEPHKRFDAWGTAYRKAQAPDILGRQCVRERRERFLDPTDRASTTQRELPTPFA